ncbi:hypothetical protein KR200_001238 [Drosophila serrata]|nr:hypothetical protein KR200_001238 [Drosophila serrata]
MEPRAALTSYALGYGECTYEQLQDLVELDHDQGELVTARPAAVQQPPLKLTVVTRQEQRPAPEASACLRWCPWATSAAQGAIKMEVSTNNTLKLHMRAALALLENGNSPTGITTVTPSPAGDTQ